MVSTKSLVLLLACVSIFAINTSAKSKKAKTFESDALFHKIGEVLKNEPKDESHQEAIKIKVVKKHKQKYWIISFSKNEVNEGNEASYSDWHTEIGDSDLKKFSSGDMDLDSFLVSLKSKEHGDQKARDHFFEFLKKKNSPIHQ